MSDQVCFICRWVMPHRFTSPFEEVRCPKGHDLRYTVLPLPKNRDDHREWKKVQKDYEDNRRGRSRRRRRTTTWADYKAQRQLRALRRKLAKR